MDSKNEDEEVDDEDDDINQVLNKIKKEEKEHEGKTDQAQKGKAVSDIQKANSVQVQKKIFDQQLHHRILMQKVL